MKKWPMVISCLTLAVGMLSGCGNEVVQRQPIGPALPPKSTAKAPPTPSTMEKDIRTYYEKNHETIVHLTAYPNYNGYLVEFSFGDPTLANRFEWWDARTEHRYDLPTAPQFASLQKVVSNTDIQLLAAGPNNVTPSITFPYYIDCQRTDDHSDFKPMVVPYYAPLTQKISFGRGKVEQISDIKMTHQGIDIYFSAIKGKEVAYYAGATDLPTIDTSSLSDGHTLALHFKNTAISVPSSLIRSLHNDVVQSVAVRADGSDTTLLVKLSPEVTSYYAQRQFVPGKIEQPHVVFTFSNGTK